MATGHRRRTKAARRIAEKTRANAEAREAGIALAEDAAPKRRYARTRSQLETMQARGWISPEQARAGDWLARDYAMSSTISRKLISTYEANMPRKPKRYQEPVDDVSSIAARQRFEAAMHTAGRWLSPVLVHVCICDLAAGDWARTNGKPNPDGIALLRHGLDALVIHYNERRALAA